MLLRRAVNWLFYPNSPAVLRQSTSGEQPQADGTTSPADLRLRIEELERQVRDFALVRVEWTEVLDKLQAWSNRQNARDQKRVKASLGNLAESPEDAPEPTNPSHLGNTPQEIKAALRQRLRAQNGGVIRP